MHQMRPTEPSQLSIAVIIVNYRAAHLVVENLDILQAELTPFAKSRIIIVDNHSPDNDAEVLQQAMHDADNINVLHAPKNGGFAYGNNRGLEVTGDADLIFFLNPDACPRPRAVEQMARTLLNEEDAGVVGARLVNTAGEERASAFARLTPGQVYFGAGGIAGHLLTGGTGMVLSLDAGDLTEAAWIPGAAMLVTRDVIQSVGGMDEGYFLYFEETDWLEAIGRAGFRILVDRRAVVEHIEGQSTGVVGSAGARDDLPDYWYDSWRRFWLKNRSRPIAASAAFAFLAALMTRRIAFFFKGTPIEGRGPRAGTFVQRCLLPIIRGGAP
ncbi:MAG: glycosyltransferase family 2 protein [Pseudomonadota bacterium]